MTPRLRRQIACLGKLGVHFDVMLRRLWPLSSFGS